jgi:hypothetical protein
LKKFEKKEDFSFKKAKNLPRKNDNLEPASGGFILALDAIYASKVQTGRHRRRLVPKGGACRALEAVGFWKLLLS